MWAGKLLERVGILGYDIFLRGAAKTLMDNADKKNQAYSILNQLYKNA